MTICDPDQAIIDLSDDVSALMRDVRLLKKWRNIVKLLIARVKLLEENINNYPAAEQDDERVSISSDLLADILKKQMKLTDDNIWLRQELYRISKLKVGKLQDDQYPEE